MTNRDAMAYRCMGAIEEWARQLVAEPTPQKRFFVCDRIREMARQIQQTCPEHLGPMSDAVKKVQPLPLNGFPDVNSMDAHREGCE